MGQGSCRCFKPLLCDGHIFLPVVKRGCVHPSFCCWLKQNSKYYYEKNETSSKEEIENAITSVENIINNLSGEYYPLTSNPSGYLTAHQDISGKQDVISDLETIRSGAAAGATALQASDLNGYLTEETLANSNVIVEINSQIAAINTLLGDATDLTNTILNA